MKKLGIFIYISAFIFSFLLAYGNRDFSIQLTATFLFSVIGMSLGAYLIFPSISTRKDINDPYENDDDCEVEGKFSIQS